METQYLSRKEASTYLLKKYGAPGSISHTTLAKLAVVGGGPEFVKFGRRVGYTPTALDTFAQGRLSAPMKSTSDRAGGAA